MVFLTVNCAVTFCCCNNKYQNKYNTDPESRIKTIHQFISLLLFVLNYVFNSMSFIFSLPLTEKVHVSHLI